MIFLPKCSGVDAAPLAGISKKTRRNRPETECGLSYRCGFYSRDVKKVKENELEYQADEKHSANRSVKATPPVRGGVALGIAGGRLICSRAWML